ncbi:MAG: transcriptional regulator [Thermoprotei archaeon]
MIKVGVFDFASRYVVPAIKSRIIKILYFEYGYNQLAISELLGISQSSVSKYVSRRKRFSIDLSNIQFAEARIRELIGEIEKKNLSTEDFELAISELAVELLRGKYLCEYHSLLGGGIKADSCDICLKLFRGRW